MRECLQTGHVLGGELAEVGNDTGVERLLSLLGSHPVEIFSGHGGAALSTSEMHRSFPDLVDWLFRAMDFPAGVVLMTGTGLVPGSSFTLHEGDRVDVDVADVGVLTNPVTVVGR